MTRPGLVSVLCAAFVSLPFVAYAECKDDSICVDKITTRGDVELRARNLRDFPITYTLRVNAKNYSVAGPNTVTRILGPGEYYHLAPQGSLVEVGDTVRRGQRIGLSGNTGHTAMPHLHFAVYRATDWGRTQSIAVRFESADGIIDRPRRGTRYQAL